MKWIDSKGKLFGKINAIDLVVVILVVALGFGAYSTFGVMDTTSATAATQPVSYVVKIERVRNTSLDNVFSGDILYDETSGNAIGTITAVNSQPSQMVMDCPDGTVKLADVENRIDLYLTVEADAVVNESGTFVNKTYELLVGSKKKFYTKYISCEGSVSEIHNGAE